MQPIFDSEISLPYYAAPMVGLGGYTSPEDVFGLPPVALRTLALDNGKLVALVTDHDGVWVPVGELEGYSFPDAGGLAVHAFDNKLTAYLTANPLKSALSILVVDYDTKFTVRGSATLTDAETSDSDNIHVHSVMFVNGWWYLFYCVLTGTSRVYKYAVSQSGYNFKAHTTLLTEAVTDYSLAFAVPSTATYGDISVGYIGGSYYMFYTDDNQIVQRVSADGVTWGEASVILSPPEDYVTIGCPKYAGYAAPYHTLVGAVINADEEVYMFVSKSADGASWDIEILPFPPEIWENPPGVFYILQGECFVITNADGSSIDFYNPLSYVSSLMYNTQGVYDAGKIFNPTILQDSSGLWHMWYTGSDDGGTDRVLHTTSTDPFNWDGADIEVAVDIDSQGTYDTLHAKHPAVVEVGGEFKMWYVGEIEDDEMSVIRTDAFNVDAGKISVVVDDERVARYAKVLRDGTVELGEITATSQDANGVFTFALSDKTILKSDLHGAITAVGMKAWPYIVIGANENFFLVG